MILSLCLLLPVMNPSSQNICSAPGVVPAPILYLSQTSARQGDSVLLQCSVISKAPAARVIFCKDGEEVFSQAGLKKVTYSYDHTVSMDSSGNYSCGYEIKESDKQVNRSQLSPAKHLSVTVLSPRSQEICSDPDQSVCAQTHSPLHQSCQRGALPAPILYLSQTSAQQGDSVLLQCSVVSQAPATRVVYCKDGEEVFSQAGLEKKVTYSYDHTVSMGSSGNYSCGYEIKESDKQVNRSQLSPAKHLSVTVLSPSSQEICSDPGQSVCAQTHSPLHQSCQRGAFPAPILYLSQTSAQQGDSVLLQCSVVSQAPATRVIYCKDGEEVFSQAGLEKKVTYSYDHTVSMGSSGNYSCGYEIKESDKQVNRSQLSPAKHLSVTALSPSSQEICSAPGVLHAPTLYLSQMSARQGDSVRLKCSVVSQAPATRVIFCKDGEEVFSQTGLEKNVSYSYDHAVSMGSSGNYSCGYEIKESNKRVTRSQLSPAQHLSITGNVSSSGGAEEPTRTEPVMSLVIWTARCVLVLLLLLSAPIITFMLKRRDLPHPTGLEETHRGSISIMEGALRAPTLYLSQTSTQQGGSVQIQCSVISQALATRIIFCKDGEEISSQTGSEKKVTYVYDHTVSSGSSGNYACGYEIKDSDKRVNKSQLSPAKHLSVIPESGNESSVTPAMLVKMIFTVRAFGEYWS
ncbi:uncharacterized protein LOC123350522 [Mauremys mutica]|uniref:uncharacterized protein LOC123350522 n=1 Tax=Mauremys mutica TaxID=74926 RepID=UPI001D165053|nr:uncharacterized protein LOC123350522 [Mauremys mutica]